MLGQPDKVRTDGETSEWQQEQRNIKKNEKLKKGDKLDSI